jgi:hypothetical protein
MTILFWSQKEYTALTLATIVQKKNNRTTKKKYTNTCNEMDKRTIVNSIQEFMQHEQKHQETQEVPINRISKQQFISPSAARKVLGVRPSLQRNHQNDPKKKPLTMVRSSEAEKTRQQHPETLRNLKQKLSEHTVRRNPVLEKKPSKSSNHINLFDNDESEEDEDNIFELPTKGKSLFTSSNKKQNSKFKRSRDDVITIDDEAVPKSPKLSFSSGRKPLSTGIKFNNRFQTSKRSNNILVFGECVTEMKLVICQEDALILEVNDSFRPEGFDSRNELWLRLHFKKEHIKKTWYVESYPECFAFQYDSMIEGVDVISFDCKSSRKYVVIVNVIKLDLNNLKIWMENRNMDTVSHVQLSEQIGFDIREIADLDSKSAQAKLREIYRNTSKITNSSYFQSNRGSLGLSGRASSFAKVRESKPRLSLESSSKDSRGDLYGWDYIYSSPERKRYMDPSKLILKQYNIDITQGDLERLNSGEFLNDNIIDFWLQHLTKDLINSQYKGKIIIFSSHFYPILMKDVDRCAKRVAGKENIFESNLVFMPVCEGAHWTLYVLCNLCNIHNQVDDWETPFIMYCDSLGSRPNSQIISKLYSFLKEKYLIEYPGNERIEFNDDNMPTKTALLPMQTNYCDCGVYVLEYIEQIIKGYMKSIKDVKPYQLPIKDQNLFCSSVIESKRRYIRKFIESLAKKLAPSPSQQKATEKATNEESDEDDVQYLSQDPSKEQDTQQRLQAQVISEKEET